ncbi:MAG: hypothetical protein LBN08_07685 [Lactobacillales bacterium]|jgi:DNA repair exonuclease SbcCD ATPase subunit|nr:hypothetical protein [Lactobacillales bacterium]
MLETIEFIELWDENLKYLKDFFTEDEMNRIRRAVEISFTTMTDDSDYRLWTYRTVVEVIKLTMFDYKQETLPSAIQKRDEREEKLKVGEAFFNPEVQSVMHEIRHFGNDAVHTLLWSENHPEKLAYADRGMIEILKALIKELRDNPTLETQIERYKAKIEKKDLVIEELRTAIEFIKGKTGEIEDQSEAILALQTELTELKNTLKEQNAIIETIPKLRVELEKEKDNVVLYNGKYEDVLKQKKELEKELKAALKAPKAAPKKSTAAVLKKDNELSDEDFVKKQRALHPRLKISDKEILIRRDEAIEKEKKKAEKAKSDREKKKQANKVKKALKK